METPLAVLQLQQENAKLQSDVVRMKSRRDQFMEESRNLRAEMVKLREAVVTRENDLLILRTQFDDTTCELEDLRHEVRWSSGQHSAHSQPLPTAISPVPIAVTQRDEPRSVGQPPGSNSTDTQIESQKRSGGSNSIREAEPIEPLQLTSRDGSRSHTHAKPPEHPMPTKHILDISASSDISARSPTADTTSHRDKRLKVQHPSNVKSRTGPSAPRLESASFPISIQNSTEPIASTSCRPKVVMSEEYNLLPAKVREDKPVIRSPKTLAKHFQGTVALILDPTPEVFRVSRFFLCKHYRASNQHFFAFIRPEKNPSSTPANPVRRRMIFPNPKFNPDLPKEPGASGLILCSIPDLVEHTPYSVFRLVNPDPVEWEYLGDYKNTVSAKMTGEEFATQTHKIKWSWAQRILTQEKWSCYTNMRARIYLRKRGKILTGNAISDAVKKTKGGNALDAGDIVKALCRGDEGLDVVRMECLRYDYHFAQHLRDTWGSPKAREERKREKLEKELRKAGNRLKAKEKKPRQGRNSNQDDMPVGDAELTASESEPVRRSTRTAAITSRKRIADLANSDHDGYGISDLD